MLGMFEQPPFCSWNPLAHPWQPPLKKLMQFGTGILVQRELLM